MPQTFAHLSQFANGSVEFFSFGREHLAVDARAAVWCEHRLDLVERETGEATQSDQRQPFQHLGIEHTVQPASADRGDQSFFLIEAQRRRGKARAPCYFGDIHLPLLTSSQLEVAEYAQPRLGGKKEMFMETVRETDVTQPAKGGPNPGWLRPPLIFLVAILLGIATNQAWPLRLMPPMVSLLGPFVTAGAVVLFLLSYRAFRAAGTSVQGNKRTTVIVRTGPYRISRNPIYLAFILFVLGLSAWLNNLWLLVMLVPPAAILALVVIPREERFLKQNFNEQYASYQADVRRWL